MTVTVEHSVGEYLTSVNSTQDVEDLSEIQGAFGPNIRKGTIEESQGRDIMHESRWVVAQNGVFDEQPESNEEIRPLHLLHGPELDRAAENGLLLLLLYFLERLPDRLGDLFVVATNAIHQLDPR